MGIMSTSILFLDPSYSLGAHQFEERSPLPHLLCLLFPSHRLSWLMHEAIVPWSTGHARMFLLPFEPWQLLAPVCYFRGVHEK